MECARPAPAPLQDCHAKARCRSPPGPALNRGLLRRKAPAPESPAREVDRSSADRPPCRSPLCGDPPTAVTRPATPSPFHISHLDECAASPALAPLASNCGYPILATSSVARVGTANPNHAVFLFPIPQFAILSHRRFEQTQLCLIADFRLCLNAESQR